MINYFPLFVVSVTNKLKLIPVLFVSISYKNFFGKTRKFIDEIECLKQLLCSHCYKICFPFTNISYADLNSESKIHLKLSKDLLNKL